jgi:exodeoxyribonuclease VII small subunit
MKYSQKIAELESLVSILEEGSCELEDALKHYQKGLSLSQECLKILENAEQKMLNKSQE